MADKNSRRNQTTDALFDAILSQETREECYNFWNGIMREKILLTGQKIIVFIFQQTERCYCWKIRKDLQGCLQRREYIMY